MLFSFSTNLIAKETSSVREEEKLSNPPLPPENFFGKQVCNTIHNRTFIANLLLWTTSNDPSVIGYYLYRNGELIAVIPAHDPLTYEDNNRKKRFGDIYHITSVNEEGLQSIPLILVLPN